MATMKIKEHINIKASPKKIFPILNDLNHWQSWSPWTIAEPEAEVKVSADGKSHTWDGKIIGAGELTIAGEVENESIAYDLNFLRPWKSKAKTHFTLSKVDKADDKADNKGADEETTVTWSMESKLPFFLFWMKNSMENFVGMDYRRGLLMLKDLVENQDSLSHLEFVGEKNFAGLSYIGIQTKTSTAAIGESMAADFKRLQDFMSQQISQQKKGGASNNAPKTAFSIYHKWDFKKGETIYTAGVPFDPTSNLNNKDIPEDIPQGFIKGKIPAHKTYSIEHKGPYRHIANAWSVQMMLQRGKVYQVDKRFSPFELYHNDPKNTKEKDLLTEVLVAMK